MVSFPQLLKAGLLFFLGIILAYVFPYKFGGIILDIFENMGAGQGLHLILTLMQWLIMFVMAFVVPVLLLRDSKQIDKVVQKISG